MSNPSVHDPDARRFAAAIVIVLAAAAAVRGITIQAGLPYLAYVDEGHVLHRVTDMISRRSWEPHWYIYPSLLMEAIVVGSSAFVDRAAVVPAGLYYDIIEPARLILVGRLVVLIFAVGIVGVLIALATRLLGRRAGLVAGILAAFLPALVSRSAIVITDTPSTFFVLAATYSMLRTQQTRGRPVAALAAGLASGLAIASKYTAAAIVPAMLIVFLAVEVRVTRKLWLGALGAAGVVIGLLIGVPALFLRTAEVLRAVEGVQRYYAVKPATVSCLRAATAPSEVGPVLLALASFGLPSLLRSTRTRATTLAWLVFSGLLLSALLAHAFQPFRNALPVLPFLCLSAACALERVGDWLRRRPGVPRAFAASVPLAGAAVLALVMFWTGIAPYLEAQRGLKDTRVVVREWLQAHVGAADTVIVLEDLAFVPSELARVPASVTVPRGLMLPRGVSPGSYTYVVSSSPETMLARLLAATRLLHDRPVAFRAGHQATPAIPGFWRGNDEAIVVYGPVR